MMGDEEKRKEERVIQWQRGLLVSGQKKNYKVKKGQAQQEKRHMQYQDVWKEKWRQSLQANSHHISLATELSLNPPSMCLGE